MKKLALFSVALFSAASMHAAIIEFDLIGTAGFGLLPGNEPGSLTGGTGGEFGAGILYNEETNLLNLTNVGWGSSQGAFSNLSSVANNSHIHGPTAGNNGGGGFTQTAGVLITLTRSSSAVTGGVFTNPLQTITEAQETDLKNGRWYINIHTANNGGGELRGFLVPAPVPEPATAALAAAGLVGFMARRRRTA